MNDGMNSSHADAQHFRKFSTLMRLSEHKAVSSCLTFSSDAATRAGPGRAKSLVDSLPCQNLLHHSTTAEMCIRDRL